jgi:hypothetical protein
VDIRAQPRPEAAMIDPLSPLFHVHAAATGAIMPNAADPAAAQGLMIVGIAIILGTAAWAAGGVGAAIWTALAESRERRLHTFPRSVGKPSAR